MVDHKDTLSKLIDIREQVRFGFARTFSITLIAIRYRLFRSLITVAVIAVTIAFMMNILSESLIKRSVILKARDRIAQLRLAATWTARLSRPGTVGEVLTEVAGSSAAGPRYLESRAMGGFTTEQMHEYHLQATDAVLYLKFFADLNYGQQRRLVRNATGTDIFDLLQNKAQMKRFRSELKMIKSIRLVRPVDDFETFLGSWPKLKAQTSVIRQGRSKAIAMIGHELQGRSFIQALTDMDGSFGQVVRQAGFVLDEPTARSVARQARRMHDVRLLEETVLIPEISRAVAARLDVLTVQVGIQSLWKILDNQQSASWYLGQLKEQGLPVSHLSSERLVELARIEKERTRLARTEQMGRVMTGGLMGLGQRMTWLVLVSMVVCVVGITNAMLMSVTERFREIATLKCLGALDGTIMLMFVLEACLLGVIGGFFGSIGGALIGLGRMSVRFGAWRGAAVPLEELLISMLVSIILGVILAAMAAVYPSFKAARLAPMEAMRIE